MAALSGESYERAINRCKVRGAHRLTRHSHRARQPMTMYNSPRADTRNAASATLSAVIVARRVNRSA